MLKEVCGNIFSLYYLNWYNLKFLPTTLLDGVVAKSLASALNLRWCTYEKKGEECHQWSTRPDPHYRSLFFLLEICYCLAKFWRVGTDVRTTGAKIVITTVGRPRGSKKALFCGAGRIFFHSFLFFIFPLLLLS